MKIIVYYLIMLGLFPHYASFSTAIFMAVLLIRIRRRRLLLSLWLVLLISLLGLYLTARGELNLHREQYQKFTETSELTILSPTETVIDVPAVISGQNLNVRLHFGNNKLITADLSRTGTIYPFERQLINEFVRAGEVDNSRLNQDLLAAIYPHTEYYLSPSPGYRFSQRLFSPWFDFEGPETHRLTKKASSRTYLFILVIIVLIDLVLRPDKRSLGKSAGKSDLKLPERN